MCSKVGKGRWRRAKEGENEVASSGGAASYEEDEVEDQPREWRVKRYRSKRGIQARADVAQGRERLKEGDEGGERGSALSSSFATRPTEEKRPNFLPKLIYRSVRGQKADRIIQKIGKAPIKVVW